MDPLLYAMLARHRDGREDGGLAWSALPTAPVVPERRRRSARHLVAVALRAAADRLDARGSAPRMPSAAGGGA